MNHDCNSTDAVNLVTQLKGRENNSICCFPFTSYSVVYVAMNLALFGLFFFDVRIFIQGEPAFVMNAATNHFGCKWRMEFFQIEAD